MYIICNFAKNTKHMSHPAKLEHPGRVSKIENDTIYIDIQVESACSKCHAHSYCTAFGKSEKEASRYPSIVIGDLVNVVIKETLGFQALLLGYIFPVIVLLIALFTTYGITQEDGISAIVTLVAVGLYYVGLILLKDKLKKHFTFELERI
jgi:sigma-E factor negative regulatory protein RseC